MTNPLYTSVDEALSETYRKSAENLPIAATDGLIWYTDRLLSAGKFDQVAEILTRLDLTQVHVNVLTAIVTLVSHAKNRGELVKEWDEFFQKTCTIMEALDPTGERARKFRARPWGFEIEF
jgi:hypothetical protein